MINPKDISLNGPSQLPPIHETARQMFERALKSTQMQKQLHAVGETCKPSEGPLTMLGQSNSIKGLKSKEDAFPTSGYVLQIDNIADDLKEVLELFPRSRDHHTTYT